jgi:hypothetical protein
MDIESIIMLILLSFGTIVVCLKLYSCLLSNLYQVNILKQNCELVYQAVKYCFGPLRAYDNQQKVGKMLLDRKSSKSAFFYKRRLVIIK